MELVVNGHNVLLVVLIVVFCAATGTSLKSINALMDLL